MFKIQQPEKSDRSHDRKTTSKTNRLLSEELITNGYAADDGVALHFIGDRIHKIVSSRATAKAYYLEKKNGKVVENLLHPQYLGNS
jgi:hypothetical protein